jgi:hypothetical protein
MGVSKRSAAAAGTVPLPFLNTYRTMCITPEPEFPRMLEEVRELQLAA